MEQSGNSSWLSYVYIIHIYIYYVYIYIYMYILTVVLTLEIRWTTNDFPKFEKRPQANQPYKWVFLQKLLLDKATMFRFLDPDGRHVVWGLKEMMFESKGIDWTFESPESPASSTSGSDSNRRFMSCFDQPQPGDTWRWFRWFRWLWMREITGFVTMCMCVCMYVYVCNVCM